MTKRAVDYARLRDEMLAAELCEAEVESFHQEIVPSHGKASVPPFKGLTTSSATPLDADEDIIRAAGSLGLCSENVFHHVFAQNPLALHEVLEQLLQCKIRYLRVAEPVTPGVLYVRAVKEDDEREGESVAVILRSSLFLVPSTKNLTSLYHEAHTLHFVNYLGSSARNATTGIPEEWRKTLSSSLPLLNDKHFTRFLGFSKVISLIVVKNHLTGAFSGIGAPPTLSAEQATSAEEQILEKCSYVCRNTSNTPPFADVEFRFISLPEFTSFAPRVEESTLWQWLTFFAHQQDNTFLSSDRNGESSRALLAEAVPLTVKGNENIWAVWRALGEMSAAKENTE